MNNKDFKEYIIKFLDSAIDLIIPKTSPWILCRIFIYNAEEKDIKDIINQIYNQWSDLESYINQTDPIFFLEKSKYLLITINNQIIELPLYDLWKCVENDQHNVKILWKWIDRLYTCCKCIND